MVAICNQAVALVLRELDALDEGDQVRSQLAAFAQKEKLTHSLSRGPGPRTTVLFDAKRVAQNAKALPAATKERRKKSSSKSVSRICVLRAVLGATPLGARKQKEHAMASDISSKTRLSQRVATMLEPLPGPPRR